MPIRLPIFTAGPKTTSQRAPCSNTFRWCRGKLSKQANRRGLSRNYRDKPQAGHTCASLDTIGGLEDLTTRWLEEPPSALRVLLLPRKRRRWWRPSCTKERCARKGKMQRLTWTWTYARWRSCSLERKARECSEESPPVIQKLSAIWVRQIEGAPELPSPWCPGSRKALNALLRTFRSTV